MPLPDLSVTRNPTLLSSRQRDLTFGEKLCVVGWCGLNRGRRFHKGIDDSNGRVKECFWSEILHPVGIRPDLIITGAQRSRHEHRTAADAIVHLDLSLEHWVHFLHSAFQRKPLY